MNMAEDPTGSDSTKVLIRTMTLWAIREVRVRHQQQQVMMMCRAGILPHLIFLDQDRYDEERQTLTVLSSLCRVPIKCVHRKANKLLLVE